MDTPERSHARHWLLAAAVAAPWLAALALLPFRERVPTTSAALLVVLVVVGVASPATSRPA